MIVETGFSWRGVGLYALVGVPLILLQYVLAREFDSAVPNIALILVVHAAFFRGVHEAGVVALMLGALTDAQDAGFFGYHMVLAQISLIVTRILAERIFSETGFFQSLVVLGLSLGYHVAGWLLLLTLTEGAPTLGEYAKGAPLTALVSAGTAFVLAALLTRMYRWPFFQLAKRGL